MRSTSAPATGRGGGGVDIEVTDANRPVLAGVAAAIDPAEDRVDAGDDLARAERLGHVVVGADPEADEDVGLGVAGGQHQHRDGAVGLDPPAGFDPVEARRRQVEDDEVGAQRAAELDPGGPVGGGLDGETLGAEASGERVGDELLVLDDGDRARHRRSP